MEKIDVTPDRLNYDEILKIGLKARSALYIMGFISEVENEHINDRLMHYKEKFERDVEMVNRFINGKE